MQQNPDMAQLAQMARSPAGQRLMGMLQQSGGQELQEALNKASGGDYADAKKAISALLQDPQVQDLIKQLGGQP